MLKRNRFDDDRSRRAETAPRARGGVSLLGVLTGVVVAFGAIFLLSAVIGGVLATTGLEAEDISRGDVIDASIAGGIAFVVAQLLAYLWGGYTAGRMARGSGALNGFLVPLLAVVLALIVGAIAAGLGASAELNLPFNEARLPLEENYRVDWGIGLGIAALVAMFLGGIIGGALGARWHTKLERRAADEVEGRHITPQKTSDDDRSVETSERQPATRTSEDESSTTSRQPNR